MSPSRGTARGPGRAVRRGALEGGTEGWFLAGFTFASGEIVSVERYLADEEGIRNELNSWAAVLETCEPQPAALPLMERTIQSKQLFVVRSSAPHPDSPAAHLVCRTLAGLSGGFYQVDEEGFFDAAGTLLVRET